MNCKPESVKSTTVNGATVSITVNSHVNLLSFLRTDLGLTGSKSGCATGNCGACTVLIDDNAVQSCQVSLSAAADSNIQTIEHIVQTSLGNRIAAALVRNDAAQCGYCLPGIVVSAYAELLTADSPDPIHALQHNLCRCGTHSRILSALNDVMAASD